VSWVVSAVWLVMHSLKMYGDVYLFRE